MWDWKVVFYLLEILYITELIAEKFTIQIAVRLVRGVNGILNLPIHTLCFQA